MPYGLYLNERNQVLISPGVLSYLSLLLLDIEKDTVNN